MLVRQIGDFGRFLEVISFSQASQVNLACLAREAEIPRKRAKRQLVQHHISAPIAAEAICPPHSTNTPPQIHSSVLDRHPESEDEGAGFSRKSSLWAHA